MLLPGSTMPWCQTLGASSMTRYVFQLHMQSLPACMLMCLATLCQSFSKGLAIFLKGFGNLPQRVWQSSSKGLAIFLKKFGNLPQRVCLELGNLCNTVEEVPVEQLLGSCCRGLCMTVSPRIQGFGHILESFLRLVLCCRASWQLLLCLRMW